MLGRNGREKNTLFDFKRYFINKTDTHRVCNPRIHFDKLLKYAINLEASSDFFFVYETRGL